MKNDTFLNFAYGSNMPSLRIKERCPSARFIGVAGLNGYELRWHKQSMDGSGKCDVVPSDDPNCIVYGVLYEIAKSERTALDHSEGGYQGKTLEVVLNGQLTTAIVYIANRHSPSLEPYTWYKDLVILGAHEHDLPSDYIRHLSKISAKIDADAERCREKEALVESIRVAVNAKPEAMLG